MANYPSYTNYGSYIAIPIIPSLCEEKSNISQHFLVVHHQMEAIQTTMADKHAICARLRAEHTQASDTFKQYLITWRDYSAVKPAAEADKEVQYLLKTLTKFGSRIEAAEQIFHRFYRDLSVYGMAYQGGLNMLSAANNYAELSSIAIPNLKWYHAIPDPNIEHLTDEWNQMALHPKILNVLDKTMFLMKLAIRNMQNPELCG